MTALPLDFITDLHAALEVEVAAINARTATKPRRLTWDAVAQECRAMGWTVRATGFGKERAGYPIGTSRNHPSSHFTDDPEDMLGTIRADIARTETRQGA